MKFILPAEGFFLLVKMGGGINIPPRMKYNQLAEAFLYWQKWAEELTSRFSIIILISSRDPKNYSAEGPSQDPAALGVYGVWGVWSAWGAGRPRGRRQTTQRWSGQSLGSGRV